MANNNILPHLSYEEKLELIQLLEEKKYREEGNKLSSLFPLNSDNPLSYLYYPKHLMFFQSGAQYKQRLFMAANRVGKTQAGCYELVVHLTGRYPAWWQGKRFSACNHWWVAGKDSKTVKSILQDTLLGQVGAYGTGMIPRDCLDFATLKDVKKADGGVTNIRVKHSTGAYSSIEFKTYDSGRSSFEGTSKNIFLDEEPPLSVFTECLLRTMTRSEGGDSQILYMTFTPLKGISETVMQFLENSEFKTGEISPHKHVTMAGWEDVPHLSQEDIDSLWASIPDFQKDARSKGIPSLGAGVIFPIPESEYLIDSFVIPDHYLKCGGLDVGWNRTAAVFAAIDPNTNVIYIYDEHYRGQAEPSVHATAIKARGSWLPIAIDTAARGRSQIDGENLFKQYKDLGLNIFNADKSVETGLGACWELLSAGQIKVFKNCKNFMDEIRLYRRDEKGRRQGEDHLMDAFRYMIMTARDKACVDPSSIKKTDKDSNWGRPRSRFGL